MQTRRTSRVLCLANLLVLALATGCDSRNASGPAIGPGTSVPTAAGRIVARTRDSDVAIADVEPSVAMRLYDLEIQQFHILRDATVAAVIERIATSDSPPIAELALVPPAPPRLPVTADDARLKEPSDTDEAPVTIIVFCNFESPHCARLQIKLDVLDELFPNLIAVGTRDLILPFHRSARLGALAGRCALEQGPYWPFHDALYATSGPLDQSRIDSAAAMSRLSVEPFRRCIESGRWSQQIDSDLALAAELGLDTVPTVFVNGLYAGLEPLTADLIWIVEQELTRLGVDSPRALRPDRVTLSPMRIRALLHSEVSGQGVAFVSSPDRPADIELREGDTFGSSIVLQRITDEGLYLLNSGVSEILPFDPSAAKLRAVDADAPDTPFITPHIAVPVTLDRDEVRLRLADRLGLAQALEPVAMRAGDYHLLRVREVAPESLYALLGFEPGDVILGVNEQTVHEADNPLWRSLEQESEVRVRVMRSGGISQHFTYRFED